MPFLLLAALLTLQTPSAPPLVGLWDFEGLAAEAERPVTPVPFTSIRRRRHPSSRISTRKGSCRPLDKARGRQMGRNARARGSETLTGAWDRKLHDLPAADVRTGRGRNAGTSTNAARETEVPYRTIAHRIVQGRLWLHVELLDQVCRGGEPKVIDTGWVPAQSPAGDQWAWFWSRGC